MSDFYVSTSGSNSNPGTIGSPFLTLDYALSRPSLAAGDTIHLDAGSYPDAANTDFAGSSGNPITIQGAGVGQTIIRGALTIDMPWYVVRDITFDGYNESTLTFRQSAGIILSGGNANDVIIEDCSFSRASQGVECQSAASLTPSRLIVRNCDFSYGTGAGSLTLSGADHSSYSNVFHDSVNDAMRVFGANASVHDNVYARIYAPKTTGLRPTSTTSRTIGTGTHTFTVAADLLITAGYQYCVYSQAAPTTNFMVGFITDYTGTTLTMSVYSVTGSGTYDDWAFETGTDNDNGQHGDLVQTFVTSSGTGTTNLRWYNNYVEDTTCQWGNLENNAANDLSGDFYFYNNVFVNSRFQINIDVPDTRFYNNSFYGSNGYTTGIKPGNTTTKGIGSNCQVYNNIFIRISGTSAGTGCYSGGVTSLGGSADYNILTATDDGAFTGLSAGANSINGGVTPAQVYTDADAGDLTLASGSPAIGAGTDLSATFTTDINGDTRTVPWTIGAYTSDEEPPADPPAAPTGLSAVAAGTGQIDLTWTDNAGDENGFKVERSTTGAGSWVQIATLGVGVEAYSDSDGLLPGTTYYYRVMAYNGAGDSDPSNTANATTTSLGAGQPGTSGLML